MSHSQFHVELPDALVSLILRENNLLRLNGESVLLGGVKAGLVFSDPDDGRVHVELPGAKQYREFQSKVEAVRWLAKNSRRLLPACRDYALRMFRAAHPYVSQTFPFPQF